MTRLEQRLSYAPGTRRMLRLATISAALAALAGIALLALAGWFLTAAAIAGAGGAIAVQAFNYLVPSATIRLFAIVRTMARYGERLWSHRAALDAMAALRGTLFARLAAQDSRSATALSGGDAATRLTADIDALEDLIVRRPTRSAALLAALAGVVLTASAGWGSALLLAALLAALPFLLRRIANRLTATPARAAADALGQLRSRYIEYAAARPEIAAYGLADRIMADLRPLTLSLDRARAQLFVGEGLQAAFLAAYTGLAVSLILISASGPAPLVALALLSGAGSVEAMAGLSRTAFRQASVAASLQRLAAIEALPHAASGSMPPLPTSALPIRLGDAMIAPGSRIAIAGRSGSGKTLLMEGLAGLRAIDADAMIDGKALADCPDDLLTAQFALSPQDAPMLAGSIGDNLRLARSGVDEAAMAAALHVACLDTLPGGLDYRLGEAGGTLSGGERKRLSIARALLAGRPWLLLDEPTEGLDRATEARLVARLEAWLDETGTGLILISHRPAPLALTEHRLAVERIRVAPLAG